MQSMLGFFRLQAANPVAQHEPTGFGGSYRTVSAEHICVKGDVSRPPTLFPLTEKLQ